MHMQIAKSVQIKLGTTSADRNVKVEFVSIGSRAAPDIAVSGFRSTQF